MSTATATTATVKNGHSLKIKPIIRKTSSMKRLSTVLALLSVSATAYSEGSPWLPSDATTTVGISVTRGSTDKFFIGDESTDLGNDLTGTFTWLNASYGYDDIWAFDARTGHATSRFEGNPPDLEQSDVADTSLGVSYQFINEFEADNGMPTIAGRLGYTFGGSYDTNTIDAIGDGASGFDASLLVGKSLTSEFSIYGDLTYRQRDDDVPDGVKLLVSGQYASPIPNLGFLVSLAGIRTDSDSNFGDPGVDFSQTNKDADWFILGANYGFANGIGGGISFSTVLSGTNVPDTDIVTLNLGYSF